MLEFKSLTEFEIKDRGLVKVIPNNRDRETSKDTEDLLGQIILIDNQEYTIIGIEFMGYHGWNVNDPMGCLVKPI